MDPEPEKRASDIFDRALELPEAQRARFLDEACRGDARFRNEIQELLDAAPKADALFGYLAIERDERVSSADPWIDRRLGGYRLVKVIGEGGMGMVYLAERTEPDLRMRAAVKLVRSGFANESALRRFRDERQVLADLSHPNIARLLDGGTSDEGVPYLVMEYVEGVPIDRYCEDRELSVDDRLRLFRDVCSAVHYAHRHLVVHRDLKPSNILVDADGCVKLLDFGIAKMMDSTDVDAVAVTATHLRALTPRYASPEQVRGTRMSTATDVYSLGVILYQLLASRLPYETDGCSAAELERLVCDVIPVPPSKVIAGEGTARFRRPRRSRRQRVSGDLDTIVMKALRKEPERRYLSVEELSDDVRRHLDGQPIGARPDTIGYRLSRHARRNPLLIVAAAAIFILVVVTPLVSPALYRHAVEALLLLSIASTVVILVLYRRALAARRVAEEQTTAAEWLAYTSSLAAAEGALRANRTLEARRQLERAPARHRAWEWRHLWGRLDRTERRFAKHKARVNGLVFSPDGTWMATGGLDGEVRIWSPTTGVDRHVISIGAWIEGLDVTPDGRALAVVSRRPELTLYDPLDGSTVASRVPPARPTCVSAVDDERLAVGSSDGTLLIVARRTLDTLWNGAHDAAVSCLAVSPRARLLAAGLWDGKVRVYDTRGWTCVLTIDAHRERVTRMDFSGEGKRLVTSSGDTKVKIWEIESGAEVQAFHGFEGMVGSVLFTPNAERVLAGDSNSKLLTFDTLTGEVRATLRGAEHAVYVAARHPDGSGFATTAVDGSVHFWSWDADDVRWLIPDRPAPEYNWVLRVAASPDGRLVATASRSAGADVWDSRTGRRIHHVEGADLEGGASCVRFAPGNRLFTAHASGRVSVTDLTTGTALHVWQAHAPVGEEPSTVDLTLAITALDVSPDGSRVLTASMDGTIKVWDAATRELRHVLTGHAGVVTNARFSPDGTLIASCGEDATVRLWRPDDPRASDILRGHTARIQAVAFSPDGSRIASASNDGSVRLWDVPRRSSIGIVSRQTGVCSAVAFTHDGSRIACGHLSAIWIHDPRGMREVVKLEGHVGRVLCLEFACDDTLLSASIDGTAGIWDVTETRGETRERGAARPMARRG